LGFDPAWFSSLSSDCGAEFVVLPDICLILNSCLLLFSGLMHYTILLFAEGSRGMNSADIAVNGKEGDRHYYNSLGGY